MWITLSTASLKFLAGKAVQVVVNRLMNSATRLAADIYKPARWSIHRAELHSRIKDMPFIYKDLDGTVLQVFVAIDVKRLDLDTLAAIRPTPSVDWTPLDRMRERKKVLIIGNAGIGKTTFMRHTLLTLLAGDGSLPRFFDETHLVPFYVPLKGIDANGPYPILRYLLANNTAHRGASGINA